MGYLSTERKPGRSKQRDVPTVQGGLSPLTDRGCLSPLPSAGLEVSAAAACAPGLSVTLMWWWRVSRCPAGAAGPFTRERDVASMPLHRKRILQPNSLAQDWARDWRALALTQVHHWSRLSDSREDGEALSSVHSTALAVGKLARKEF